MSKAEHKTTMLGEQMCLKWWQQEGVFQPEPLGKGIRWNLGTLGMPAKLQNAPVGTSMVWMAKQGENRHQRRIWS